MKALVPSSVLPYIGTLCDSPFKRYKSLTKTFLMWNMWEGFHSSFKPAQAYGHRRGEKTLNWTQLISIVAPVWSKRLSWKVIRCCTLEKDFKCHIFEKNISVQPASYIITFLMRFHVLSIGEKVAKQCNQCNYSFSEVGNLRMHLMKNTLMSINISAGRVYLHLFSFTMQF